LERITHGYGVRVIPYSKAIEKLVIAQVVIEEGSHVGGGGGR